MASSRPRRPVAALAHPALTTTPREVPERTRSRVTRTGAAQALWVVNVPAAAAGVSETTSTRSLPPLALIPAATPAARNPAAAHTPATDSVNSLALTAAARRRRAR